MSFDLAAFGKQLAALGLPLLGAALPIPGGAAIGTALAAVLGVGSANPADVIAKLQQDSTALAAAHQFELQHQEKLLELTTAAEVEERKADSADLAAVNATMAAEAANSASENWFQKGWRPFNGYVVGLGSFVAVCFVCYLFGQALTLKDAASIASVVGMVPQLATSIALVLGVPGAAVGITAWHRGVTQRIEAQKGA